MKAIALLFLLVIAVIPQINAAVTTSIGQPLTPFQGTVSSVSKPPPITQIGLDLGQNTVRYAQSGIQFFRQGGNITIGLPSVTVGGITQTVSTVASKNSTNIRYAMTFAAGSITYDIKNTTQAYNRKISMSGTLTGSGTLKMTLGNPNSLSSNLCNMSPTSGLSISGNPITNPPCSRQCYGTMCFDWADVPSFSYDNSSRILTINVASSFVIDPLAVDGSATGSAPTAGSVALSGLTTSNSNDIIIVYSASGDKTTSVTDTASLTWTQRIQHLDTGVIWSQEWYATSSGTLSGDVITLHQASSCCNVLGIAFGISGGNTATPFDSNGAVPGTGDGVNSIPTVTGISTSNANDMLIGLSWDEDQGFTQTAGTGYTLNINYKPGAAPFDQMSSQYKVVSSTQSSVSVAFGSSDAAGLHWTMIADAIQAFSGVTQPIKITTANSAPAPSISITGCSPSNSSFSGNGNTHTYSGLTANCTITLTTPAVTSSQRYDFLVSPKAGPTESRTVTFNTCASGTCALYQNTTWDRLNNTYEATPLTPSTWDGSYLWYAKGEVVGVANVHGNNPSTTQGGGISKTWEYFDYNTQACNLTPIGNSWIGQSPTCFTDTTAGNVHNVNYVQGIGSEPPNLLWLLAIPAGFILAFAISKKR